MSSGHWKQIILNICLFIPLGYFLTGFFYNSHHPCLRTLLSALLVSASIEVLQYLTYRGMLDVDDLVSNVCGAALGLLIYRLLCKANKQRRMVWIMLTAGFVGCIITAIPAARSSVDVKVTKEFRFSVSSVAVDNGKTVIEGECFLYDRKTRSYTILVGGSETVTDVDGQTFRAKADVSGKAEVQVKFRGFPPMPTGVWINPTASGVGVEYVAGEVPVISGLPETAVLKAWSEEYDTLVYQDGDRLLWLIGSVIDKNTEIIYHIHTTEPEKLPEKRIQYGFDNRGFRAGSENDVEGIDHYRVFEKKIPEEYYVTAVVVGFNTDGMITWSESFRIE